MVLEASRNDEYEGNFILEMLGFESSRDSSGRDNRSEARMAKGNLPPPSPRLRRAGSIVRGGGELPAPRCGSGRHQKGEPSDCGVPE